MAFFTNSAIHMYAHGSWAEVLMLAGGAELGLVHGRLKSRWWRLTWPVAFVVTGTAFIVHEQNPWFFARSAFLHHLLGWTFIVAAVVPLALVLAAALRRCCRRASPLTILVVSVQLFSDRDVAPIFGHLSPLAGDAAPMRRLLVIALAALAFPAAAFAHATLKSTTPSFRQELPAARRVIRLHFDQQVKLLPGADARC